MHDNIFILEFITKVLVKHGVIVIWRREERHLLYCKKNGGWCTSARKEMEKETEK